MKTSVKTYMRHLLPVVEIAVANTSVSMLRRERSTCFHTRRVRISVWTQWFASEISEAAFCPPGSMIIHDCVCRHRPSHSSFRHRALSLHHRLYYSLGLPGRSRSVFGGGPSIEPNMSGPSSCSSNKHSIIFAAVQGRLPRKKRRRRRSNTRLAQRDSIEGSARAYEGRSFFRLCDQHGCTGHPPQQCREHPPAATAENHNGKAQPRWLAPGRPMAAQPIRRKRWWRRRRRQPWPAHTSRRPTPHLREAREPELCPVQGAKPEPFQWQTTGAQVPGKSPGPDLVRRVDHELGAEDALPPEGPSAAAAEPGPRRIGHHLAA